MTPDTLHNSDAENDRSIDRLALFSGLGAAVCAVLAAVVLLAPDAMSRLTAGTAVMYDAMIWMAEICRFD